MPRTNVNFDFGNPVHGINTVDDPRSLRPGEVLSLVNARPGDPPELRKGCDAQIIASSTTWTFVPPGEVFFAGEKFRAVVIAQTAASTYLVVIFPEDTDGTDHTVLATLTIANDPLFALKALHGHMFIFNSLLADRNRVIESDGARIRPQYIGLDPLAEGEITASGDDGTIGTFAVGDCIAYAWTAVRRGDTGAFTSGTPVSGMVLPPGIPVNSVPKLVNDVFLPGLMEDNQSSGKVIEIVADSAPSAFYFTNLNFDNTGRNTALVAGGATHIRVYRSYVQATEEDAQGATKYWLVDIPLGVLRRPFAPAAVDTGADTITLAAHGWETGQEVRYSTFGTVVGGLVSGTKYYVIKVDVSTIKLAATYLGAVASTGITLTSQGVGDQFLFASWADTLSDLVFKESSPNFLDANQYSPPPVAEYVEYVKDRLWVFSGGFAYHSEAPGGGGTSAITGEVFGGGTQLSLARAHPLRWATWFRPLEYFLDIDSGTGEGARGLARLGNDLYFFKESKIYVLYGSDPTTAVAPVELSPTVGCAFPHTLTKADTKSRYGSVLLFLSNEGPMMIEEGGRLRPFVEFRVKELWPNLSTELYGDLESEWDHIKNHCTAKFWRNEWWVMYQTAAGVKRIWAYYFNTESVLSLEVPMGPYEVQLGGST
jgi:hypothetical protein